MAPDGILVPRMELSAVTDMMAGLGAGGMCVHVICV